jgi:hypothetical protein
MRNTVQNLERNQLSVFNDAFYVVDTCSLWKQVGKSTRLFLRLLSP